MSTPPRSAFVVVVPVKPVAHAKSRLAPLGHDVRRSLVAAFAVDTVAAALASPLVDSVVVVTDDDQLAGLLSAAGAGVIPDGAWNDLNASLVQGVAAAVSVRPGHAVAALCADLPALRTAELSAALDIAARHDACFVADAEGTGTTMVTALAPELFISHFGRRSAAAHRRAGLRAIVEVEIPTLRRDVDTPADLTAALEIGVGPCTSRAVRGLRL